MFAPVGNRCHTQKPVPHAVGIGSQSDSGAVMHLELLAFALVLTVGCGAFVYGVVCLVGRVLAFLGRGVSWFLFGPSGYGRTHHRAAPAALQRCRRPGCGHVENRPARFCAQCGAKMGG